MIRVNPNNPEAARVLVEVEQDYRLSHQNWVIELRQRGVKAAHPDDGWVDRQRNRVHFCYPHFDLKPSEGDIIALGWHWQWRLVEVTRIEKGPLLDYYAFRCLEPEEGKRQAWWGRLTNWLGLNPDQP